MISGVLPNVLPMDSSKPLWSHGAATGSPLHAPATPDETAAPALDPAVYHHVAQVIWVVKDIDRVVDYWQRLGIHNIHRDGVVSFPKLTYRGKPDPARAKQVTAEDRRARDQMDSAGARRQVLAGLPAPTW